jgi:hypothetical protein
MLAFHLAGFRAMARASAEDLAVGNFLRDTRS